MRWRGARVRTGGTGALALSLDLARREEACGPDALHFDCVCNTRSQAV